MDYNSLINEAWEAYDRAIKILERGDIRDAAEKAWLSVENMRKAIMVAAKVPYEITKKISVALNVFNGILKALKAESLLEKYYYFQATLHGLSFYEGILNEDVTIEAIMKVEEWLREAESIIEKARNINARPLVDIEMKRRKIQSEILSKAKELIEIRRERAKIIDKLKIMEK